MARIEPIAPDAIDPKTRTLLEGVERALGTQPNIMKTLAHSPAALQAYLGLGQALAAGSLGGPLREQLALAIAGVNACDYCASAHTALGRLQKIDDDELARNLHGESDDPRTRAALQFARAVVAKRGFVGDDEIDTVRDAGFTDGDIAEIVAVVANNVFSNYFNHVAQTEIDFPVVRAGEPVA